MERMESIKGSLKRRCIMKYTVLTIICFGIILYVGGCGQQQEKSTDDTVAPPLVTETVQFENDYVKVTEFMLKPGGKLPLHKGGPRVVYALSDYTIRWTEGDQVSEKKWQKGDVHWHNAIEHAVENIGDTDAHYIVITRKDIALPKAGDYAIDQDASQLDSDHANIIFENDQVRVINVNLAAGESQPMHHGVNRLIYSLTSYQIEYTSDQMDTQNSRKEAGDIHWHTADKHAVKNNGETVAHYLIFEFMQ
jgi:quercetin dioxygenase-like cupin family protein